MTGWQDHSFETSVKKGETVSFCMYNDSKMVPYCDGSHKGTGITPKVITFDKDDIIHACGCQHSKNRPYCDDTHNIQ